MTELKIVGSHGDAIEAVKRGETDIAIVKNPMETLLALKSDPGPEAAAVRRNLGIQAASFLLVLTMTCLVLTDAFNNPQPRQELQETN